MIDIKTAAYLVFTLLASWMALIVALWSLWAAWREIKIQKDKNAILEKRLEIQGEVKE